MTHRRLAITLPHSKDHLELARRRICQIDQHLQLIRLKRYALARFREDA